MLGQAKGFRIGMVVVSQLMLIY